jgi:tripartite-type tricarboxylate transporter receptor subunit TctC
MPAKDLKELIAWLKANPGKATQGTAGAGSAAHIAETSSFLPIRLLANCGLVV